jgi:type II secretory pathway pseudopilin PulG
MKARQGMGLAELLVSVALAGVVMAAASRSLTQHLRWQRNRAAIVAAEQIVQDAHEVLRAELERSWGEARVLGDTAVDVPSLRGFFRACEAATGRLVLPNTPSWWTAPRSGDSLAVLDTLTQTEWRTLVAAVGAQRASSQCPAGGAKLTLASPVPLTAPVLALPVRVWRIMRYTAYRGSDGTWWLGERACAPTCGLVQPVAGPLLPPSQGGLRMALVLDHTGRPQAIDLLVRAEVSGHRASVAARIPIGAAP